MELDQFIQLVIGIGFALLAFIAAYMLPLRIVVPALIILSPFELISSRYGTSSTGLVYLVTLALLLRGQLRRFPMIAAVSGIFLVYLISLVTAEARLVDHVFYIIRILPGFLLFYVAYNYVLSNRGMAPFFNVLLAINTLVLVVSAIQFAGGKHQVVLFGIKEFALRANRVVQGRLNGPFGAEFTSEYLALASLILVYLLMRGVQGLSWPKWSLWVMLAANLGVMVMTGSRGGIVVFVGGLVLGLFLFRHILGMRRAIGILTGAALIGSIMAMLVIQYTEFNVLLNRLEGTKIENGVIDTRSVTWPTAWEEIKKKPFLGHGPRLRLEDDWEIRIPGHKPIPYPHSLILFILYTLGIIGLVAYTLFFFLLWWRLYSGARENDEKDLAGLSKLGMLLLIVFLVDEIKIEFLRFIQSDYQAIIFTIFGGFLAIADRARLLRQQRHGMSKRAMTKPGEIVS